MDLSDLRTGVKDMTDEELLKSLMEIRANRRIAKPKADRKPTTSTPKAKTGVSTGSLLANMSQDALASMIAELEKRVGGKNGA